MLVFAAISSIRKPPTDIILSNNTVREDSAIGTVIGNLSSVDPLPNNTFTYSIVTDVDNKFTIVGNQLRLLNLLDYETNTSHSVTIRSTNVKDKFIDKVFTINIGNIDDYLTQQDGFYLLQQNNDKIIIRVI